MPPSLRPLIALLAGATAIGLAPILVRLSEVGPVATAFQRLFLALPVLGLWLWWQSGQVSARPAAGRAGWLILAGACFAADLALWHWSIRLTTVANAALFANAAPFFVALGSAFLFGTRFNARYPLGLLLAFAGAALLLLDHRMLGRALLGDALALATAVFYAGYLLAVAHLRRSGSTTIEVMFWSALVTALLLLPLALLSEAALWPATVRGFALLVALALVSHVAGQGLIAWALAHLPAAFGAVALLWQPAAAAVFGAWLLGEMLGGMQLAAMALVLCGIALARGGLR